VVQGLGPEFKSQYCKKIYDWVRKENKLFWVKISMTNNIYVHLFFFRR
jgi:hypothetical protein